MIDFVNNDTDKLYEVMIQYAVCGDHYGLTLPEERYELTPEAFHYIKKLSTIDWFQEQRSSWNLNFAPDFAEIVTRRGAAFSFNMVSAEKLFNFDQ